MDTTTSPAVSRGENVPEIQALTERIRILNQATDWWNAMMVLALVLAAISAVAVVGTTMIALKRAKQVADAQSELIQAKDKQLDLDLGDKNVKIAQAGKDASTANRDAARANERATKAQESLALAEQHSAEANTKAEGFRLDIAKANERAASANETAERERLSRLQLEARLADRIVTPEQKERIATGLRSIGRRTVDITIFGDALEIITFSGSILECFTKAEWSINISRPGGGGASARGVLMGVKPGSSQEFARAANLIISILRESVGDGIGTWEYDKLTGGGLFSANSSIGTPAPPGESPLRIVIGSK